MTGNAVYVYGVVPAPQEMAASCGIGGAQVTLHVCGDLAALISDTAPGAVARTRRNMLAHTTVLEAAMTQGTVLPLRFGTVAPALAALQECISANRTGFHAALNAVHGRVELGLKASWKPGIVYDEIVERDPALRQLRDRLRSRPAAETYYERIELGRRVEAALAGRRESEAALLTGELAKLREREAELRPADDDMIFNRAFLVRRETEAEFDLAVQRIATSHGGRIELRYVGPVPPFNFVSMQAGWLTPAVAQAR